jgi:hypothetical protein
MSSQVSAALRYSHDFEISLSEGDLGPYLEYLPRSYERFEAPISLSLTKKDLSMSDHFFLPIASFDFCIFESDSSREDTRIIKK